MSLSKPKYPLMDFSNGMNISTAAHLIADTELVDAKNCVLGVGYVQKRDGYAKWKEFANKATELFEYTKQDGTKELLAVNNKQVYRLKNDAFEAITGTLTSDNVQFLLYEESNGDDVVLIADNGKLKKYNGTAITEVTPYTPTDQEKGDPGLNDMVNLTNFRCLALKDGRIFGAGNDKVKNRISFTHIRNTGVAAYDYWPATHYIDLAFEENDEIVTMTVFRDALIVFCKRTVWAIYGSGRKMDAYNVVKINVPTGCIAPKSVAVVENELYYLSERNVYALFSTERNFVSSRVASRNIEKNIASINNKETACAIYFHNRYLLSFQDGTTFICDTLMNPQSPAWVYWTNVSANSFLNRNNELYFSSGTSIFKFQEGLRNDDGQPICFKIVTKNLDFGSSDMIKKIRKMKIVAHQYEEESSEYDLSIIVDYVMQQKKNISTDESGIWDEGDWDNVRWDFVDVTRQLSKIRLKGYNIQFIVENNYIDQPFKLYSFHIQFKLKGAWK